MAVSVGIFKKILMAVGSRANDLPETPVTGFLAMMGAMYKNDLMIVGRSVNGWADGILPSALQNKGKATKYAQDVQNSVSGNGMCPMMWVSKCWGSKGGYNTKRSAFWRVVRLVVENKGIANVKCPGWPSFLVWSNLYKVSPSGGGNPGETLCRAQFEGCVDLLKAEIEEYRPKRILFMTGLNWVSDFFEGFKGRGVIVQSKRSPRGYVYVEDSGSISLPDGYTTSYVVAVHPQGKPEDDWVKEVCACF